jgi:hypothetical protein
MLNNERRRALLASAAALALLVWLRVQLQDVSFCGGASYVRDLRGGAAGAMNEPYAPGGVPRSTSRASISRRSTRCLSIPLNSTQRLPIGTAHLGPMTGQKNRAAAQARIRSERRSFFVAELTSV